MVPLILGNPHIWSLHPKRIGEPLVFGKSPNIWILHPKRIGELGKVPVSRRVQAKIDLLAWLASISYSKQSVV